MTLNKKLKWLIGISSIAIGCSIAPILVSCSESHNNNNQDQSNSNNDYVNPMPDDLNTFDAEFEWLWSTTFFPGLDNYFQDKTHDSASLAQLVPTNIPWQDTGVRINNWYNDLTDLNTIDECIEKQKNKVKKYVQDCSIIGDNYFNFWNGDNGELLTYICNSSPCYGWYEIHEGHLDGKYDLIRWTRRV